MLANDTLYKDLTQEKIDQFVASVKQLLVNDSDRDAIRRDPLRSS